MFHLVQHYVETLNIGGIRSQYEDLTDNDNKKDLPLIRKLRNGHNQTVKFHRDKMGKKVGQLGFIKTQSTFQKTSRSII